MERRLEAQRQLLTIAQNESSQHQQLLTSTSNQLVNARRSLADANARLDDKKQRSSAVTIGDLEDRLAALQSSRAHQMAALATAAENNHDNSNSRLSAPLPSSLWASTPSPSAVPSTSSATPPIPAKNNESSLPSPSSMSHESKYQAPAKLPVTVAATAPVASTPAANHDTSHDEHDNNNSDKDNDNDDNDEYEQSVSTDEPPAAAAPITQPLRAPLSSLSMPRSAPLSSLGSGNPLASLLARTPGGGTLASLRAPLQPLSTSSTPSITVTRGSLSPTQVAAVAAAVAAASSYAPQQHQAQSSSVSSSSVSSFARPNNIPPASPLSPGMPSEDDVEVEVDVDDDDDDHEATASVSTGL